ncbi:MAG: tail fiber protein [Acidobacteriota bacterium]|nr:tail fiber protein [Acidobacteriota bacterium]
MAEPFLSEIKMVSFNFAPKGWALCNGQLLPINQNQALFALLGTYYGGDGRVNFALPDLRGRVPISLGSQFSVYGQTGGEVAHTLTYAELPSHVHFANGSTTVADQPTPVGNLLGTTDATTVGPIYAPAAQLVTMNPSTTSGTGGSQPHENMMPYLALTFCIALTGIFPSHN